MSSRRSGGQVDEPVESARGKASNGEADLIDLTGLRQQDRQNALLEHVMREGTARIDELADLFGVSAMTVHRDLDHLVAQGLLRKSRGTATAVASSLFEASTPYRAAQNVDAKRALARAARELIEPGQAIMLDDSTTGLYLAEMLHECTPTTVVTNFLGVVRVLAGQPDVNLVCLGGQYYKWCDAFMGGMTIDSVHKLRADLFFMSTSAVTDDICFHQTQETVMVKRAMFESAHRRVLYVDHTKFTRRALHALGPLSDFDDVIVDDATPGEDVRRLQSAGVNVHVVGMD